MTEEKITKKPYRMTVAIDVDGVLNSYVSGWTGAGDMPDAPNPGAMLFLKDVTDDGRFDVVIVSSRLNHDDGEKTVREWLWKHLRAELGDNVGGRIATSLKYSETRPPAHVTIDDRGLTFMGEWPSLDRLVAFAPYYKKPMHLRPDPETAVAAIDALMTRIGRVAQETGCPEDMAPLDWLEESARLRRQALIDFAKAELAKTPEEDPDFVADVEDDVPIRTVAVIRTDLPAQWEKTARRIVLDGVEHYLVEGRELTGDDEAKVDGLALGIGDVPERMARFAAARGKIVDEVLADPSILKVEDAAAPVPTGDPMDDARDTMLYAMQASQAQRISDLARDAIVHLLSGGSHKPEIERLHSMEAGHEWKVPYRGGHVWMPERAFLGCRNAMDAGYVAEAFLDAFGHGMARQREIAAVKVEDTAAPVAEVEPRPTPAPVWKWIKAANERGCDVDMIAAGGSKLREIVGPGGEISRHFATGGSDIGAPTWFLRTADEKICAVRLTEGVDMPIEELRRLFDELQAEMGWFGGRAS